MRTGILWCKTCYMYANSGWLNTCTTTLSHLFAVYILQIDVYCSSLSCTEQKNNTSAKLRKTNWSENNTHQLCEQINLGIFLIKYLPLYFCPIHRHKLLNSLRFNVHLFFSLELPMLSRRFLTRDDWEVTLKVEHIHLAFHRGARTQRPNCEAHKTTPVQYRKGIQRKHRV